MNLTGHPDPARSSTGPSAPRDPRGGLRLPPPALVELGRRLAAARGAQRLSQQALQDRAGVQQAEISRIERGAGNPTAATLLRLADALGQELVLVPAPPEAAAPSRSVDHAGRPGPHARRGIRALDGTPLSD